MQRFFVSFPLTIDLTLTDPDILHQLTRVLRVQVGESLVLFDGDGSETMYHITEIAKKSITLRGQKRTFPNTEPQKKLFLYQALPNKIEKIEYILQKGVEIGIYEFHFFRSDFSQKLILSDGKKTRFESIVREAVEQCSGLRVPKISFSESIPHIHTEHTHIVLDTVGKVSKISDIQESGDIALWVWPEGGWSEKERSKMLENGFLSVRFWERVFRTETAGVVVSFALINS